MREGYDVLVRPVVTEKSTGQTEEANVYTFIVNKDANKHEIARAVEKMWDVTVKDVRTMRYAGKAKRSVLDEWKKWADRVPKRLDIVFNEIRITQRQITIGGTTASAAEAERFQAVLNDGGQFRFELPKTEPAQDGRTRFTMRHEYEE